MYEYRHYYRFSYFRVTGEVRESHGASCRSIDAAAGPVIYLLTCGHSLARLPNSINYVMHLGIGEFRCPLKKFVIELGNGCQHISKKERPSRRNIL